MTECLRIPDKKPQAAAEVGCWILSSPAAPPPCSPGWWREDMVRVAVVVKAKAGLSPNSNILTHSHSCKHTAVGINQTISLSLSLMDVCTHPRTPTHTLI